MVTLKDIAASCNVSVATVSRILNEDQSLKVTPQLKELVFDTALRLGYVPKRQRKSLRHRVGFIAAPIAKAGYEEAFFERLGRLSARFDVGIEAYHDGLAVDGLILLGDFTASDLAHFSTISDHVLLINSNAADYRHDRIIMDYQNAEEQVLDYFAGLGIDDIGYFGGIHRGEGGVIGERRYQYFKQLLEERGLLRTQNIHIGTMDSMSGYHLTMSAPHLPRALLIGDCSFAEGALRALSERQSDAVVVVYQDMEEACFSYQYPHSVLQIFSDAVFETACKLLLERIRGERNTVYSISVPATLIHHMQGECE